MSERVKALGQVIDEELGAAVTCWGNGDEWGRNQTDSHRRTIPGLSRLDTWSRISKRHSNPRNPNRQRGRKPRVRHIFIAGGTGYIGSRLIPLLRQRGHIVRALARRGSESKVPAGCEVVLGDPFDRSTFAHAIAPADTFVQLVGVPHPSPAKAQQFLDIDLRSARQSIAAASSRSIRHFVYVSVAQPAPVMRAYQATRAEAERELVASGLAHTIVRPWYVLGPGHRWPYALLPMYWLLERLPSTRESATRLGLVTIDQMLAALVCAVEQPAQCRIVTVPEIRASRPTQI